MKLLIPKIGTRLVLSKPWTFKLTDEYRNETFWLKVHGEPNRATYYYGYSGGCHCTSPTPTATATSKGHQPADPIDTTFPEGTSLFIESFHIQKGHEPKIALRTKKEEKSSVPSGKFLVHVNDLNKMEIENEIHHKYPLGRFTIQIADNFIDRHNCKCHAYPCHCNPPKCLDRFLLWNPNPDGSEKHKMNAKIRHRIDSAGLDVIEKDIWPNYEYRNSYCKHFGRIETLMAWAGKKGFTNAHVSAFIKLYEEKRLDWEKSKA